MTASRVYAPYTAAITLIVGLSAASVMPKAPEGVADYSSSLSEAEQRPLKL
jgi:hypothetical protein